MSFIQFENISFSYPAQEGELAVRVLENFSLHVEEGEFVALLGSNGCGKSTVAQLCNAILVPSEGRILADGLDTSDEKNTYEIRRRVGLVLQNPDNQLVASIVEEDVAFGPENLGLQPREIRNRVARALERVGMEKYRKHSAHQLSGGQKQRIAIAGILAMEPRCIVLDEPTAMLDPRGRRDVMDTIRDLNKRDHVTILLITHHMEEAVTADRVVAMDRGRILTQGSPGEVFSQVDLLKSHHLDVPQAADLAALLRQQGLHLPDGILDSESCIAALEKQLKEFAV